MSAKVNSKVKTPLGEGTVQGAYGVIDGNGGKIGEGVIVRLPVDETTKKAMRQSNCITPRAKITALFVFRESELK